MGMFLCIMFICVGLISLKVRGEHIAQGKKQKKWYDL